MLNGRVIIMMTIYVRIFNLKNLIENCHHPLMLTGNPAEAAGFAGRFLHSIETLTKPDFQVKQKMRGAGLFNKSSIDLY